MNTTEDTLSNVGEFLRLARCFRHLLSAACLQSHAMIRLKALFARNAFTPRAAMRCKPINDRFCPNTSCPLHGRLSVGNVIRYGFIRLKRGRRRRCGCTRPGTQDLLLDYGNVLPAATCLCVGVLLLQRSSRDKDAVLSLAA